MMYWQLLVHGCFIAEPHSKNIVRRHSLSHYWSSNRPLCNQQRSFMSLLNDDKCLEQRHKPLVVILAGPTASGKSAVAALLSSSTWATEILTGHAANNSYYGSHHHHHNSSAPTSISARGHVISADSVQVYTGLQIGANKPTREEIKQTPHHLVGIIDPKTTSVCEYNAADWMNDALYVIQKLTSYSHGDSEDPIEPEEKQRRKTIDNYLESTVPTHDHAYKIFPIVTGGTMMYLQWLVYGHPDAGKPTNEAIQRAAQIIQYYQHMDRMNMGGDTATDIGWDQAVQLVSSIAPIFAQRVTSLSGKDWYRLRRTLEVALSVLPPNAIHSIMTKTQTPTYIQTLPAIELQDEIIRSLYSGQRQGALDTLDYDVRCFFLCPDDRMTHSKIVDQRCEDMILEGLIQETCQLLLDGCLPEGGQQTRAIGYRQTLDYLLRKDFKEQDEQAFFTYLEEFTSATRRYSKKQMQWFRKDESFLFIPVQLSEEPSVRVEAAAAMIRDLCIQSREMFNSEIESSRTNREETVTTISAQTKLRNAMQSAGMKFYINKRIRFVNGSPTITKVIADADACAQAIKNNITSS